MRYAACSTRKMRNLNRGKHPGYGMGLIGNWRYTCVDELATRPELDMRLQHCAANNFSSILTTVFKRQALTTWLQQYCPRLSNEQYLEHVETSLNGNARCILLLFWLRTVLCWTCSFIRRLKNSSNIREHVAAIKLFRSCSLSNIIVNQPCWQSAA